MADEPKNNLDGHVVLSVAVGDDVHHIAFPASTPLPAVHEALLDHVQPPDLKDTPIGGAEHAPYPYLGADVTATNRPAPKPTKEGAYEYSDENFRNALSDVWKAAGSGKASTESGTYIDADGTRGPIATSTDDGHMTLRIPTTALNSIHSHPQHMHDGSSAGTMPSDVDKKTAAKMGKIIYVVSHGGLSYVTPQGDTGVVYTSPAQFEQKTKAPVETYTVPKGWTVNGPTKAPGLITPGNINLTTRPIVKNDDGTTSSEYSVSFQDDKGHEVLVPTVVDGKFLTPDGKKPKQGSPEEKAMFQRAWQHYEQTGQHLGIYDTPEHANAAAQQIHNRPKK